MVRLEAITLALTSVIVAENVAHGQVRGPYKLVRYRSPHLGSQRNSSSPPPTERPPLSSVGSTTEVSRTHPVPLLTYPPTSTVQPAFSRNTSVADVPSTTASRGTASPSSDETCRGPTVNIVSASLDWWYTETYTQIDSTFLVELDHKDSVTEWTLLPAETTFNVTSAIANPTCDSVTAFNTEVGETMLKYSCYDTPAPIAAATTTVEQSAYVPVNATSAQGTVPSVVTSPTPAALTIGNSTETISSGAPVVHFSKYEVISDVPKTRADGGVDCVASTKVHNLSQPYSFEYGGQDHVNGTAAVRSGVAGDVQYAFLEAIGQVTATPGSFVAAPTVVIVVQKILAAAAILATGVESSASSLDLPSPTLPSGLSIVQSSPTGTGTVWVPLSPRLESSDSVLDVPSRTVAGGDVHATSKGSHSTHHSQTLGTDNPPPSDGDPAASAIASIIGAISSGSSDPRKPSPGSVEQPGSSDGPNFDGNSIPGVSDPLHPVLTVGSSTLTATRVGGQTSPGLVIAGETVVGGSAITVDNTEIFLLPDATGVVVGGQTIRLPQTTRNPGEAANIPLLTVGSEVYTANAATQFKMGGSILTPGGEVVVSGTTLSLDTSATRLVINGHTQHHLSPPIVTPAPILTIDGTAYRPNAGSTYDIFGKLLTRGGVVTVSETTISLLDRNFGVAVNGHLVEQDAPNWHDLTTITAPPKLTLHGQVFSPNGDTVYFISGKTLTPGGAVTFTEGDGGLETVFLHSAATQLIAVSNGLTRTSHIALVGAAPTGAPCLSIDDKTYAAIDYDSGSGATYVINGQTLTPAGKITVTGSQGKQTISLVAGGTAVLNILSGLTTTSPIPGAYGVLPTAAPILTIGGKTFTAINNGATYLINGKTLVPGEADTVTIGGKTYIVSLFPQATLLKIEHAGPHGTVTSTALETLFPATVTGSQIYTTLASTQGASLRGGNGTSGTVPAYYTGFAGRAFGPSWILLFVVVVLRVCDSVVWVWV